MTFFLWGQGIINFLPARGFTLIEHFLPAVANAVLPRAMASVLRWCYHSDVSSLVHCMTKVELFSRSSKRWIKRKRMKGSPVPKGKMNPKDSWPTLVNRNDRSIVQEPRRRYFSVVYLLARTAKSERVKAQLEPKLLADKRQLSWQ